MKGSPLLKHITLENLRCSQATSALVWRCARENPGITSDEIADRIGKNPDVVRQCVTRLKKYGWLRSERWSQSKAHRHFARIDGRESERRDVGDQLARLRERMTQIAKRAHAARRSGLAVEMGRALGEIEKGLRELRDDLYVRR